MTATPEDGKLWDRFTTAHRVGELEFILPARPGQPARPVRQAVSVRRCRLRGRGPDSFWVTAVWARETDPPKDKRLWIGGS